MRPMLGMLMLEIVICIRQRHTCFPYPTDRGEPLWKESIYTIVLQAMVHYLSCLLARPDLLAFNLKLLIGLFALDYKVGTRVGLWFYAKRMS